MKNLYFFLAAIFFAFQYQAQCICPNLYPSVTITPTTSWADISSCNYAGEYANINVVSGNVYEFSTCAAYGSTVTYDSELTLTTSTNALIAYNDDYCGTQSYISWTANVTGIVRIHLTEYYLGSGCWTNTVCSNIRVKMTSAAAPPANNACSNAVPLTVNSTCNLTSGTTLGATEDPILDPPCDPGTINDVWYSFNSGAYNTLNLTVNLVSASWIGVEFFNSCGTLATGLSLNGTAGNCDWNTSAPNPTVISGLTTNTTYYFRLFTNVSFDIAGSFTACITTPPPPTVTINSTSVCAGVSSTLTATPSVAGGTYLWSNGSTASSITVSPTTTTTYTVTYSYNGVATGSGAVTVYPLPSVNAGQDVSICNGASTTLNATGANTYSWSNGVTTSSNAVSPSSNTTYTVTGTDANGCVNTDQVIVTVNAIPTLNAVSNQSLCSGSNTTAISFTGTAGATYSWVNNNTNIGLGASGSGNITSFASTNTTGIVETATITVTSTLNGCSSAAQTFTITVNPTPTLTAISNQSLCAGAATTAINYSGTAGASYAWTNSNSSIGLAASGNGNIASFTAINAGASSIVSNLTVTPSLNGCNGSPQSFTITVNPVPNVTQPANQSICSGTNTSTVSFSGTNGATYSWTNSNTTIGLGASGTGNIASFNGTNTSGSSQTSTISVTPSINGCNGTVQTFTITVNPTPNVNPINNQSICSGGSIASVTISGSVSGATYNWTNSNTSIGLAASGSNSIPGFTGTNTGTSPLVANITITPTLSNCNGTSTTYTITINPSPTANAGQDVTICSGGSATLTGVATSGTAPYTYAWNNGVMNGVPFTVVGNAIYTLTITDINGCTANDQMTITANSISWANLQWPGTGVMCLGNTHTIYGQIYVQGSTEAAGQAPGITAQAGVSSTNTDPSSWALSAWSNASFNTQVGNNDEYSAGIGQLLSAGTYYYTYRYSLGQGCPYFYAGFNGGAWNGSSNVNGTLTINNAPTATFSQSACSSYTWFGQAYTSSGTYTHNVPSASGCDSVLYLNLTIHQPFTGPTEQVAECNSYTWNGQNYTQSGTYTYTGLTQFGCDSIATLNLTINSAPTNTSMSLTGQTFTASSQNATSYAWLDCGSNTIIPNETGISYSPSVSGSYAVIASNTCGSDTSNCDPIEIDGLPDVDVSQIIIFPNPSNGIFTIQSKNEWMKAIKIFDVKGSLIKTIEIYTSSYELNISNFPVGSYLLEIESETQNSIHRIVKN